MKNQIVIFASLFALSLTNVGCKKQPSLGPGDDLNPEVLERKAAIDNLIKAAGDYAEPDTYLRETEVVEDETRNDEVWRCTRTTIDARLAPDRFSIFDPNAEVIWPGAALQGKSIQFPTPDPIIARRAGGTIIINNITGTPLSSVTLPEVTHSNVIAAANEIIRNQSDRFPADGAISFARVRSKEELALKLGASASFFGLFNSRAKFEISDKYDVSTFIVTLNQSFYTLVFERPTRAADFFHEEVTANDLKPFAGAGNYPVYVSSVTYGRTFCLLVSAVEDAEMMKGSLSASFVFGGFKGNFTHVSSLKGLYVQAFALGGDSREALNAVIGGIGSLDNFIASLRNAADIRLAKPLSYAVRSVQSATLVKNEVNTKFTVSDCAPGESTDFCRDFTISFEDLEIYGDQLIGGDRDVYGRGDFVVEASVRIDGSYIVLSVTFLIKERSPDYTTIRGFREVRKHVPELDSPHCNVKLEPSQGKLQGSGVWNDHRFVRYYGTGLIEHGDIRTDTPGHDVGKVGGIVRFKPVTLNFE